MTDTTTALLRLHERVKQQRPRTAVRRKLLTALTTCCVLSSEIDRKEKDQVAPEEFKWSRVTVSRFGKVEYVKEFDTANFAAFKDVFWAATKISGRFSTPGEFEVKLECIP